MATTFKQLDAAYDRLSNALYAYSQAEGSELNSAIERVDQKRAVLAALLATKVRKGRATDFISLCRSLVDKAQGMANTHGPETLEKVAQYKAQLRARTQAKLRENAGHGPVRMLNSVRRTRPQLV